MLFLSKHGAAQVTNHKTSSPFFFDVEFVSEMCVRLCAHTRVQEQDSAYLQQRLQHECDIKENTQNSPVLWYGSCASGRPPPSRPFPAHEGNPRPAASVDEQKDSKRACKLLTLQHPYF